MRVATRRQRAAWRVFGEASARAGRSAIARACARSRGRLGAVRDLDVQLEAADAFRADMPVTEQRALEPLLAAWREHRDDARVLLLRELDSPAVPALARRLPSTSCGPRAWLCCRCWPVQPHLVRDTAPSRDLDRVRRGARLRVGPALGRRRPRSTSCGSPANGCATRSSSCARRSAPRPTR